MKLFLEQLSEMWSTKAKLGIWIYQKVKLGDGYNKRLS